MSEADTAFKEILNEAQSIYLQKLGEFLLTNTVRAPQAPEGFCAPGEHENDILGKGRDLLLQSNESKAQFKNIQKKLHGLTSDLEGRDPLWIPQSFKQQLKEFLHGNPVYWNTEAHSHKPFSAFQNIAHTFLNCDLPVLAKGEVMVWRRRVNDGQLPDAPVSAIDPNQDVPQVYFIPEIAHQWPGRIDDDESTPDNKQKLSAPIKQLPEHTRMMADYDFVCHWFKKNAPVDVHVVQRDPNIEFKSSNKTTNDYLSDAVQGFINRFILPQIARRDEQGKYQLLPIETVKRNLSRITLVGYCYGGKWIETFDQMMHANMHKIGYDENAITEALGCLGEVSFGYRPSTHTIRRIPTLNVCNKNDKEVLKSFDRRSDHFSHTESYSEYKDIEHENRGRLLSVECPSTLAYHELYRKHKDADLNLTQDDDLHYMQNYAQLNERQFRAGTFIDLYSANVCAPMLRDTMSALVEAGRNSIRDAQAVIDAQREEHLSPDALDKTIGQLQRSREWLTKEREFQRGGIS